MEVIISILILGECAKVKIEYLNLLIDIAPSGIPRKKPGNVCYFYISWNNSN